MKTQYASVTPWLLILECSVMDVPSQCFRTGRRGWRCGCSSSLMDEGHWPWPRNWGRGQCRRLRTAAEDTTPCPERRQSLACTCCCQVEAAGGRADLEGNKINEQRKVSLIVWTKNLIVVFIWLTFICPALEDNALFKRLYLTEHIKWVGWQHDINPSAFSSICALFFFKKKAAVEDMETGSSDATTDWAAIGPF